MTLKGIYIMQMWNCMTSAFWKLIFIILYVLRGVNEESKDADQKVIQKQRQEFPVCIHIININNLPNGARYHNADKKEITQIAELLPKLRNKIGLTDI